MAKKLVLKHLRKTVTTAGTAVALVASKTMVRGVMIQAETDNTGKIYVGDSSVSSSDCAVDLVAGNAVSLDAPNMGIGEAESFDLALVYIDSSVNGDGVNVSYWVTDS